MNDKNRNLTLRIASSIVLLPIVVVLFWLGGYWTAGLLGVAAGVCASEYYLIVYKKLDIAHWGGLGAALLMPFIPVFSPFPFTLAFWLTALVFFFAWIFYLIRGPLPQAPERCAHALMGFFYGALGLTALMALRDRPLGMSWVLATLIITWGNDSCAYFAGRFLGKHKLYPQVSPNKTWEGFGGGIVGSVGGLVVAKLTFFSQLTWLDVGVVGLLGGVLGPLGDLCESMLKRAYGVKDSGKVIPGHGGLLDRLDALIFNAPMVLLYVSVVAGVTPLVR